MSAMPRPSLVSELDYLRGEEGAKRKHEYRAGRVYAMAGAKTGHDRVAANFLGIMHRGLRGGPCEAFGSDMKVRIALASGTSFYYPDGMVVCDPNDADSAFQERPAAIAEVLSDSTRRTDEGEKLDAYRQIPTLGVYLLIEPGRPEVTAWRWGAAGVEPELHAGSDAVVPLPGVGAELPLVELYERVVFGTA